MSTRAKREPDVSEGYIWSTSQTIEMEEEEAEEKREEEVKEEKMEEEEETEKK